MKKIGILSMQRVVNHGSFLQAYALKYTIENIDKSCKVEFIDLPGEPVDRPIGSYFRYLYHKIFGHKIYCLDWKAGKLFSKLNKIYTKQCAKYLGITVQKNNSREYDVIFIGSDEVFNCTQDEYWGTSMLLFGEGFICKNINSYAASFGFTTLSRLNQYDLTESVTTCLLNNFSSISVRDNNSQSIINSLCNVNVEQHLDPVLIYDFKNEIRNKIDRKNYILIYQYSNRICNPDLINTVKSFAKRNNIEILSIYGYCDWADSNIITNSFNVLEYFNKATYVLTDTFHGCVLSIKFNKNFIAVQRESNKNKMSDLLSKFNLLDRIIKDAKGFIPVITQNIEWNLVNEYIRIEKKRSIEYLTNCINR